MRPFRSIRRAWARASFAKVLPIAAFVIALLISGTGAVYTYHQSHRAHDKLAHSYSEGIANLVAKDVAKGDLELADTRLSRILPGRAVIETSEGEIIAGALSNAARRDSEAFDLSAQTGTPMVARIAPMTTFKSPIALPIVATLCVLTSLIIALFVGLFSNLVAKYIHRLTATVNGFSLTSDYGLKDRNLIFSEFRTLAVATVRTTRRLAREIAVLRDRARYDSRTGLLNEHSLSRCMERVIDASQFDQPSAFIVIEVDNIDYVIDRLSAARSDDTLAELARTLKSALRNGEEQRGLPIGSWTLAAMRNDQFGILVNGFGTRDDLASLIRDIQRAFRNATAASGAAFTADLSGSIVMLPEDGDSIMLIRQRADATLNDLRRQGKNGFAFYSPKLERQRDAQIKLELELREAVAEDRFVPLFQPKIDLSTGRICGAEALARWKLDSGRLASPSVFIELAEETGLISEIGGQIMRKACAEAVQWTQLGHQLSLAVNVSPKQFESDDLTQMILDSLADSGLMPRQLEIEITESLAIQQPERVRSVLKPLRKLGIKLAIDDFGTGHSNLAILTQLDFDVFKIDRQFVAGTPADPQANAIVEMIMSMAKTLGMTIVGEGIETTQQADFLKSNNCHIGQGFLYSPPVTADVFRKMLDEQPFASARLIA